MADVICPECEFRNSPGALYCDLCGAQLEKEGEEESLPEEIETLKEGDTLLDRFKILEVVSRRGNLASYIAQDGDKEVWIREKLLLDEDEEEEFKVQKPLLEKIAQADHNNLVRILGVFQEEDKAYIIFEKLEGENLWERISRKEEVHSEEQIVEWALQAVKGLIKIHSLKILHRDIQPSHLFLTEDGVVKVMGFGRIWDMGTPPHGNTVTDGYSPPEAYGLMGGRMGRRSDVFSMGATLYSLVTGSVPKLSRETFFNFPPLNNEELSISEEFEQLMLKAVKKEPVDRFESFDEFLGELMNLQHKLSLKGMPVYKDLKYEYCSLSHVGVVRKINQDSCLSAHLKFFEKSEPTDFILLIVADGMGGEAEGDKASSLAIRVILSEVMKEYSPVLTGADTMRLYSNEDLQEKAGEILSRAIERANTRVYEYSLEDVSRRGMGSTISSVLIEKNNMCICHAGDTRAYVYNEVEGLVQLTEDHSLVGRLVRMGQLTREEALRSPQRSAIYRALGTAPDLEVDVYQRNLQEGDYVVLCSDGVWEYYSDAEFEAIIREEKKIESIAERFINTCLQRGADDNATIIVLHALPLEKEEKKSNSKGNTK